MESLPSPFDRYLRILGFDRPPSGIEGLHEIVSRHLCRIPFENVSKLLLVDREGVGRVTTLPEYLDGIEFLDLGGTCYSNNPYLARLLKALGYETALLGADMDSPNVHTAIRVRIGKVSYHVDVGYAAPFRHPMRLDRLPLAIADGNCRYVLDCSQRAEGYEMTVFSGGERVHGYVVHEPPRNLEFFEPIILDSFVPGRTFMSHLRITRFFEDHTVELRDRRLIRHRGKETLETALGNLAELRSAVDDEFAMPRCPIEEAVRIVEQVTGKPFF